MYGKIKRFLKLLEGDLFLKKTLLYMVKRSRKFSRDVHFILTPAQMNDFGSINFKSLNTFLKKNSIRYHFASAPIEKYSLGNYMITLESTKNVFVSDIYTASTVIAKIKL